ncbi:MAG: FAD-dependent thymidylate synthase [Janthinobacterium lividum]
MPPLTPEQLADIEAARDHRQTTARATVPAMEDVLYRATPVLDSGFVRVIDYMGDDDAVVQGARVSYGRGTRQVSSDRGLIRYLMRHRHTTPFELCDLKLHVRAPIFVARQWFRHRTASINEYSGRYSVLEREFYVPDADQVATQSATNRQGRGDPADAETARATIETLRQEASRSYDAYLAMLNQDEDGTPLDPTREGLTRELARTTLPVSIYTQFYWKVNLWNLLHFLDLRADGHAQYEIRVYAEAILDVVARWVPTVHEAFQDYVRNAAPLSAQQIALVRAALASPGPLDPAAFGLSARESRDLADLMPELTARLGQ